MSVDLYNVMTITHCPGSVQVMSMVVSYATLLTLYVVHVLSHLLYVLPDIWIGLQDLLKAVRGQRKTLAFCQSPHCGQMSALGQQAKLWGTN